MGVVVDARPGGAGVVGLVDPPDAADLAGQVDGWVSLAGGGFAEPDGVGEIDVGELGEAGARIGRVPETASSGGGRELACEPDVTGEAEDGFELAVGWETGGGGGSEGGAVVGADVERAIEEAVEFSGGGTIGTYTGTCGDAGRRGPAGAACGRVIDADAAGTPDDVLVVNTRDGSLSAAGDAGGLCAGLVPIDAAVVGEGDAAAGIAVVGVAAVAGADDVGGRELGEVDAAVGAPEEFVGTGWYGGEAGVVETADVAEGAEEWRAGGETDQIEHGGFLDSENHGFDRERGGGGGIPVREIRAAVEGGAGAVEHAVGAERIDLDIVDHPTVFERGIGSGVVAGHGEPRRGGDVENATACPARITVIIPDLAPRGAAVGAAPDAGVGPPGVERTDHDGGGILFIDGEAAITEVGVGRVGRRHGADACPGASGGGVFPDVAEAAIVRAGLVVVSQIEETIHCIQNAMVRHKAGGLAGDAGPGRAAVGGHVEAVLQIGDADVDRLCGAPGSAGAFVESNPKDAGRVVEVVVDVAGGLHVVAGVGETGDLAPRDGAIGAFPEAVAVGSGVIKDVVVVGIVLKTLAGAATGHVGADLERHGRLRPRSALIGGSEHHAVGRIPRVGVHAGGDDDLVGVERRSGDAGAAEQMPVIPANPVHERDPRAGGLIPTIRAADVGACVDDIRGSLTEYDGGNITTAADLNILPGSRMRDEGGDKSAEQGEQTREDRALRMNSFGQLHNFGGI